MKGGRKFKPREMMEKAIAVMKTSILEPRDDEKASPLVGAVLVKKDGSVHTAARGELRYGDHAEFTLLERKNRDTALDGAVLFATLEPCAPGARSHPKLGCAERIVLARIREVWVGIEDPDPTVDRKGIKFLQDNGVKVELFDRDLQEKIRSANKRFIEQAEERAAAARAPKPSKVVVLSELEKAAETSVVADFDEAALLRYRERAGIREEVGSEALHRRLRGQGLLRSAGLEEIPGTYGLNHDHRLVPTGFGLLLFGKEPRMRMPQAGLLGTVLLPDGREELRDFDGPAVGVPKQAIDWLKDKLPNPIRRDEAQRRELHEPLFEMVREGLVNALLHRDYAIEGAKCQLIAKMDKIVIKSPGLPVQPITLQQLSAFDAPMLSRNPVLHFVFSKMALAEERGLGLKSMRSGASVAGLPVPTYTWEDPYLVLTLFRTAQAAVPQALTEVAEGLTDAERTGWAWMVLHGPFATADYQSALELPPRTARNHLKKLTDLGLLRRTGAGRATRYEVMR